MAVRLTSRIPKRGNKPANGKRVMLELLLYCHMFASLKYAGEIMAVMDFIGAVKLRCNRLLARALSGRSQQASSYGFWTEQELIRSLDRLDAYVASVA